MKKFGVGLGIILLAVALMGCQKKEESNTTAEIAVPVETKQEEPPVETEKPEESHEGEAQSVLTGLWIPKEEASLRPYAVMLNNIEYASPQSGTSEASILYEALAEGGITRLMGIMEKPSSDRIGSVRSARHYFVSVADEYDAIFVHYGQTKYALSKISELKINNLSGLEAIGTTVFYRDKSIKAPHNAFASAKGIYEGTKKKEYRTEYREDLCRHFNFYEEDTQPKGEKADHIKLGFSGSANPFFDYNKGEGLYYRGQFGKEHIDANTGEQLAFKNIIIQLVEEKNMDANGYQTINFENAAGEGYYITNGRVQKITWEKNESGKAMRYLDTEGKLLSINPGKTYVALYPTYRMESLSISE